jgi:hypothetical protein
MQEEFDFLGVDVHIYGVNADGHEHGLPDISALGDMPMLQDTEEEEVWLSWEVVWRDVYILDDENHLVDVYNLTTHSLAFEENYEELKAMFIAAAAR